jgi:hypothetical protein
VLSTYSKPVKPSTCRDLHTSWCVAALAEEECGAHVFVTVVVLVGCLSSSAVAMHSMHLEQFLKIRFSMNGSDILRCSLVVLNFAKLYSFHRVLTYGFV